ncbi:MAG: radical SAM/SPASM domain-containing protein [Elusimicrobiota bacterium]|nr:radical SAM/SPASM domain-containing protein [Elusimicrobiota bacterium]
MKKPFRRAFIEITNSCNLACGFCAASSRPKVFMPLEAFEAAAAQAGELAAVIFLHLLGEPFMHPRFPEILGVCSHLKLKVNLVTNGVLLDKFGPDIFSEKCLGQVSVSLHALKELSPALRAQSLRRLTDFALRRPPGVIVSFRLRGNPADLFIKEAKAILLEALAQDGAGERVRGLPRTLARAREKVRGGLKLREGVYLNFGSIFDWPRTLARAREKVRGEPGGEHGQAKEGCLGLRHHFGILSDGRVVPCCADFDGALALGNVNERPLADILGSPAAQALRDSIAGKTPMPPYCASCGFTAPDS